MKRRITRIAALLTVAGCGMINATSEFRSPLSLQEGMTHWPLKRANQAWWYEVVVPHGEKESKWDVYTWKSAFARTACKAFCDSCPASCPTTCTTTCPTSCPEPAFSTGHPCRNKNTTRTAHLSTLWFGKDRFRGEEAFAGGIITDPQLLTNKNPYLGFAYMTPSFDYNEYGAVMGLSAERRFGKDDKWRVGGRISLPFKVIEIEHDGCTQKEETLADVAYDRVIQTDAGATVNQWEYAYRLDLLSVLNIPVPGSTTAQFIEAVQYGNGTAPGVNQSFPGSGVMQIAAVTVQGPNANGTGTVDTNNTYPAAYVVKQGNQTVPCPPLRKLSAEVTSGALPAGGAGNANDASVFFFEENTNYAGSLGTNRDAQSELFIVPRALDQSPNEIANTSAQIRNRLRTVLDLLDVRETAMEFFRIHCIDLCRHECIRGLGNLDLDMWFGYGPDHWFTNFIFGVRFPSDKRMTDARRVFFQSTGNNGHYEIKVGLEGGWMPYDWFAFKLDGSWHHVFGRRLPVAAPFTGATIRNIGPCVEAETSWNYFVAHADFTFFHPKNADLGCTFGYEIFAKMDDNVKLCQTTATDLLGRTNQALDATILENRTNTMTHKLRGEMFHRWHFCELFAGASHIVAGRNAMQESEIHAGLTVYF